MTTLVFDPSARTLEGGRVLIGGRPTRLLRLTAAGAELVAGWRAGAPVGTSAGARALAERLVSAELAHPRFAAGDVSPRDVAIVIPVRDRPDELAACLERVGPCREIVIVDDASRAPIATPARAASPAPAPPRAASPAPAPLRAAPPAPAPPRAAPPAPAPPRAASPAPAPPRAAPPAPAPLRAAPPAPAPAPPTPPRAASVRVIRRDVSGGPAAARNDGVAATDAPFVAFLDSDTLPTAGWLEPLLAHFADPRVGAVAPRVRVPAGRSALARYEAVRSPLDLGPDPGIVGPGRRVGYVPAAALVVRRDALAGAAPAAPTSPRAGSPPAPSPPAAVTSSPAAVTSSPAAVTSSPAAAPSSPAAAALAAPFDPSLRFGEDVDLVWRLAAAGWTVRYEPASVVEHPHRATLRAWLRQRAAYGSSAGPLARRHPGKMRHVVVGRDALLPWALALAGRPRLALLAALPHDVLRRSSPAALALEARARTARQIADAAWRAHAPALATTGRGRRFLAGALLAGSATDYATRRPALDPARFTALRVADDLAYTAGVWAGCLRARTLAPLIPEVRRRGTR
ncbi:glycosyltransferase [Solirubrobacter soli]|uniref:glycosyltransferase n=1 Tax=Solirubrobacter soli TaxID=363832 RepID=UPI0003F85F76|nr:glycosyltransferase [Solirubrobacter soli]